MERFVHARLSEWTTFGLGGPADALVAADSESELIEIVRELDEHRSPCMILGGGSNLVIADEGVRGTVVHVRTRGIAATRGGDSVLVRVAAGEPWDAFVARAVQEGWSGVECLSGIPGLVGATPMQNVGAYGADVSQTMEELRCYDRITKNVVTLRAEECAFAYRSSRFRGSERFLILEVSFRFSQRNESMPITYLELGRALGVSVGGSAPLSVVRETVIALRRGKGMVADPSDPESRSAGSFFTNPIVESEELHAIKARVLHRLGPSATMPVFPESEGRSKLAAGWLIEQAGFRKGEGERVGISKKHALALVNRGGTTRELVAFARGVQERVWDVFGVRLEPEPILVGVTLESA